MDRDKVIKLLIDHRRDLHAIFACLSNEKIVDAAYLLGGMIKTLDNWVISQEKCPPPCRHENESTKEQNV